MASGIDFQTAQKKLDQRTKQATEKARRKLEKERILAERKAQQQEAVERQLQTKRLAELAKQEREKDERDRLLEANCGVLYRGELLPVPAAETLAKQKGIKRASDKVLLPASVGRQLLDQDAHRKGEGGYYFELESLETGRKTVSSVLDFSAAEGFIALPKKVSRCLFGLSNTDAEKVTVTERAGFANDVEREEWEGRMHGRVRVTYKRLDKGTKCIFQPRIKEFQATLNSNLDIDIKSCLEECLSAYSCLAVGDWVAVSVLDQEFDLRVKELEVDGETVDACSIIDTDLEAEVHPSIETEERILQEERRARQLMEEREQEKRDAALLLEAESKASIETIHKALLYLQDIAEPVVGDVDNARLTSVLVRFPNGEKCSRVFRSEDPAGLLFCFVDAHGASGLRPGEYKLVSQYPRAEIAYIPWETSGARWEGQGLVGHLECFQDAPRSLALFVEKCSR